MVNDSGESPAPLVGLLRQLHDAREQGDELGQRRLQSRLVDFVQFRVQRVVAGALNACEADRMAAQNNALITIIRKWEQCRAIAESDVDLGERKAWAWITMVAFSKAKDQAKKNQRLKDRQRRELERERWRMEQRLAAQPEPSLRDTPDVYFWALGVAAKCACKIIEDGEPRDLRREAREHQVYASLERVKRSIQDWEYSRLSNKTQYEIALDRGYEGDKARLQNRVAKSVERGRWALWIGARLAASLADNMQDRETFQLLVDELARPRRKAGKGDPS